MREAIAAFFRSKAIAVAGASRDEGKFGFKVYRRLKSLGRYTVYPVNPLADAIDGDRCFKNLAALPERPDAVIFITPPPRTAAVMREALELGVKTFWMQPGADGPEAVRLAEEAGASLVYGRCVLITDPGDYVSL
ncbi:MAG: CoA-binding protein [bacterium]|nr:CoA-binding protein [bacterium]